MYAISLIDCFGILGRERVGQRRVGVLDPITLSLHRFLVIDYWGESYYSDLIDLHLGGMYGRTSLLALTLLTPPTPPLSPHHLLLPHPWLTSNEMKPVLHLIAQPGHNPFSSSGGGKPHYYPAVEVGFGSPHCKKKGGIGQANRGLDLARPVADSGCTVGFLRSSEFRLWFPLPFVKIQEKGGSCFVLSHLLFPPPVTPRNVELRDVVSCC